MSDVILKAEDLKKYFKIKGRKVVKAVDGVSIEVERGKTLGLVGESGCGKSTLGRTLIRIYEPTEGKITLNGKDISGKSTKRFRQDLARSIQMIFQDPYACLSPRMTVSQLISEGWGLNHAIHMSAEEKRDRVIELLETVGLNEEHANRFPHEFSGGQRQRIGIARALSMSPELIICDEPISALDVSIQAQVMNLLLKLQQDKGLSYIFIAHDLSMVRYISDTVAVMYMQPIRNCMRILSILILRHCFPQSRWPIPRLKKGEAGSSWKGRFQALSIHLRDVNSVQDVHMQSRYALSSRRYLKSVVQVIKWPVT